MKVINSFSEEYSFLSNFHPCQIIFEGETYSSVEHAFQSAKTLNKKERELIRKEPTPGGAKKLGRKVQLRDDWYSIRLNIMFELLVYKFLSSEKLKQKLLDTGYAELIEGNHWYDIFWGQCKGVGENHLGKMLMHIRHCLANQNELTFPLTYQKTLI